MHAQSETTTVVSDLVTPVILGIDFLVKYKVLINLADGTVESPVIGKFTLLVYLILGSLRMILKILAGFITNLKKLLIQF